MAKKNDRARQRRQEKKKKRRQVRTEKAKARRTASTEADDVPDTPPDETEEEKLPEYTGGGIFSGMRGMLQMKQDEGGSGLNKRRSLTEWALWAAVLVAAYFAYQRFFGGA